MNGIVDVRESEATKHSLQDLGSRLQSAMSGRLSDLRLSLESNGLVIHGRGRSYYDKQLVQHLVRQLCDLPFAENRVEVEGQ